jgi:hypothetical protein
VRGRLRSNLGLEARVQVHERDGPNVVEALQLDEAFFELVENDDSAVVVSCDRGVCVLSCVLNECMRGVCYINAVE